MTAAAVCPTAAAPARSTRRAESTPRTDAACAPADALFTTLYADLCRLARRTLWRNGAQEVLGTGTLVHEVWLDIGREPSLVFENNGRFLAYAARTMRGLVIDRIRARHAQKRGGAMVITSLDTQNAEQIAQPEFLERVGEALDELSVLDPDLAHIVDLKFFCGFGLAEVATMKGVSERTVQRQWKRARLLLYDMLNEC